MSRVYRSHCSYRIFF